jgi:hypothetical protein
VTLAAQHRVSQRRLRLIACGTLDDPTFVRAIRKAAKMPHLWELVAPAALEALVIPTVKIERLGGSLDDLLGMLLESLEVLRHPIHQNFARHTSAIEHVNLSLDLRLQALLENEAKRGRLNIQSLNAINERKSADAANRAEQWHIEVEKRKRGLSKNSVYTRIGKREGLSAEAVKKKIGRHRKPLK